ncbi:S9 family peptidase [Paenibacillus koleovorans]|uniref:S9 family peptidase n=1 Tax=Paenibacillus koleovorans TaxID=121608 RepID=UPI000FDBDF45|nr:S9 family peptidase [Paenibacillus koleovorans]
MSTRTSANARIPKELLFGNPVITNPMISPDGKQIAFIAPYEGVLNIWLRSAAGGDERVLTQDSDRGIQNILWCQDSRHLFYLQDSGGNENFKLYTFDTETGDILLRTPYDNIVTRFVARSDDHPELLLIALNVNDPKVHDIYQLNVRTNELKLVLENKENAISWMVDKQFQVRGLYRVTKDGGAEILVRDTEQAKWRTVVTWDSDDSASSRPFTFSPDGKSLYLADARNSNTGALVKLDLDTGAIEPIASDPVYDVSELMIHPFTLELQAVLFHRERMEWQLLDESLRPVLERLRVTHAGEPFIQNRSLTDREWLVGYRTDIGPTSYYLFHLDTMETTFLFDDRPELTHYELAPKQPISFASRDGWTIHGYLTRPPGVEGQGPLVLVVHGGPWGRDTWGYDAQCQWLANLGYSVLQVNFRGSAGYGKHFLNAGDREWGAKMHDDLVDAVQWAVEQGVADPQHVAIFGGSYGGYAALAGATFTPDLFRCAVDVVGPSNLLTLIRSVPPYWMPMLARLHKRVGNPDLDEAFLRSRSPLFHVDNIKIPILIAQGANDPRVKQAESEQIVEAMREKGLEYVYLLFEDEGHGFAKPANRMKFYETAETFLLKHLS